MITAETLFEDRGLAAGAAAATYVAADEETTSPTVTLTANPHYTLDTDNAEVELTADGAAVVNAGGTLSAIELTVTDGDNATATATATPTVTPVNDPPTIVITAETLTEDGGATVAATYVAADEENASLTVTFTVGTNTNGYYELDTDNAEVELTADGAAVVNAGGTLSAIELTVTDGDNATATATATPTVTPVNDAPVASAVKITGELSVGKTLTGSYTFEDEDSDGEGTSTYLWLRDGTTEVGTELTYKLAPADSGRKITFKVTPVDTDGLAGAAVTSDEVKLADPTLVLVLQRPEEVEGTEFGVGLFARLLPIGATASDTISLTVTVTPDYPVEPGEEDFKLEGGDLTIKEGDRESGQQLRIITFDNEDIGPPTKTLTISATAELVRPPPEPPVPLPAPASVTLTILDDDEPEVDPEQIIAERVNRVIEMILPETARAMLSSTLDAVTGRIERAISGAPPAGAINLAGASRASRSDTSRAWEGNEWALRDTAPDVDLTQLLSGSSFVIPLGAAATEDGTDRKDGGAGHPSNSLALWGSSNYNNLSGGDDSAVDWDGEVMSGHLGVDAKLSDEVLAGLSLSLSKGSFDYTDRTDNGDGKEAMSGEQESRMISFNPYVGWTLGDIGLWATAGYGWGEIEIDDEETDAQTSDMTQWSAAAGARGTLYSSDDLIAGGTTRLTLRAQGSVARIDVEGAAMIEALSVDVYQGRSALEASHAHSLGRSTLTPSVEVGLRYDGGGGETGAGVELGGSLRYANPVVGLTVEGYGRTLLVHGGDYEEWGVGGFVRLDPGSDGTGLSLSLEPGWGETASGVAKLWNDGATGLTAANDNADDNEPQGRLDMEVGYGFATLGGDGVLTPYTGLSLSGEGTRRLRVGGRFEMGTGLDLSLEGERGERAGGEPDHGVILRGKLRF